MKRLQKQALLGCVQISALKLTDCSIYSISQFPAKCKRS